MDYVQRFVENNSVRCLLQNAGGDKPSMWILVFLYVPHHAVFFFPDRLNVQIGCVACSPSIVWMHFLHAEIRSTYRCGWNGIMKQLITGLTGRTSAFRYRNPES